MEPHAPGLKIPQNELQSAIDFCEIECSPAKEAMLPHRTAQLSPGFAAADI